MMKLAAFASTVPGLVVSVLLVSDWITCLRLVGALGHRSYGDDLHLVWTVGLEEWMHAGTVLAL